MRTRDFFGMGFFGHRHFDLDERKQFCEEWNKMADSEKLEIMNKKIEAFNDKRNCNRDFFSIEHFDAHCQEWMSKTPEEKSKFVEGLKKTFEERHRMMKEHFLHHEFEGCYGRERNHFH